jgi:pyruvate dehydrogenase E1 component alpha subunit
MLRIRFCEESLVGHILNGEIKCPVHLCSGQEAIAAGVCAALERKDYVFGTHRSHGHYLAKGGSMRELIAEIYGKETGCSKGRGGSMHICAPEIGFLGAIPIVGGTIALAAGCAFSAKLKKEKKVTVSFFGDGATGEGVLYESLNFAALKKLPIIFVCENNQYSTHMPIRECRPKNNISEIARPFCIRSYKCDGNDVIKVYETAKTAVDICRRYSQPAFIEFITYRLRGHVGVDDNLQGYHTDIRPKAEREMWNRKDPITRFENYLLRNGILAKRGIEEIKISVTEEVDLAHAYTAGSKYPKKDKLVQYVFKK